MPTQKGDGSFSWKRKACPERSRRAQGRLIFTFHVNGISRLWHQFVKSVNRIVNYAVGNEINRRNRNKEIGRKGRMEGRNGQTEKRLSICPLVCENRKVITAFRRKLGTWEMRRKEVRKRISFNFL